MDFDANQLPPLAHVFGCFSVQTAGPVHSHAQASAVAAPALLMMCEDTDGCSRWQFQGGKATGSRSGGAVGDLTVERFDRADNGIVSIRRTDSTGSASGLTAEYTGTRSGPMIEGKVRWKAPGHPDGETRWRALILRDFREPCSGCGASCAARDDHRLRNRACFPWTFLRQCWHHQLRASSVVGLTSWKLPGKPPEGGSTWSGTLPSAASPAP